MSWIDDNKGQGPWEFAEQGDKRGYINNPRWVDEPVHEDQHLPCGYWPRAQVVSTALVCSQTPIDDWLVTALHYRAIAYNSSRIYVLGSSTGQRGFTVYSDTGTLIYDKITTTTAFTLKGIAVDDDYVYIGYSAAAGQVCRIERYAKSDGAYSTFWKVDGGTWGLAPKGLRRYGSHLYVTSVYGLHKYSLPSGTLVWEVAVHGTGVGEFWTAYALDLTSTHIYVADYSYRKVIKYLTSDGSFVSEHDTMIPSSPRGLSILGEHVFMTAGSNIYVFDLDMSYICTASGTGTNRGPLCNDSTYFYGVNDGVSPPPVYKCTVTVQEASEVVVPISEIDPEWPFAEQPNKPHYNEGNLISDCDDPVWRTDHLSFSDEPITPTHHPWCGYWHKDYTPPIPPTPPGCDPNAVIGYTTLGMQINERQTLQALVDGVLDDDTSYTWDIISGGGSLGSPSGDQVFYDAPSSNANCNNNPTITLSCKGIIIDTITIAINGSSSSNPACTVYGSCVTGGLDWYVNYIRYYCSSAVYDSGDFCHQVSQSNCNAFCNHDATVDNRTQTMKDDGCCPSCLL